MDTRTDNQGKNNNNYDPSMMNIKCYRCREMGYKSNVCPEHRDINLCEGHNRMMQSDSDSDDDTTYEEAYPNDG